jgi:hypothetical protein
MASYLEILQAQADNIYALYEQFKAEKPVMVFDIQQAEVLAFPYEAFKAQLNRKSQANLAAQYRRAQENNYIVVFVRDTVSGAMASYTLDIKDRPQEQPEA